MIPLSLLATGGAPPPPPIVVQSGDHLHFDGNSITNEFLASPLSLLAREWLDTQGISVTVSHTGINGQTWDHMGYGRSDVALAFDAITATGRKWLIVGETTNAAFNASLSTPQIEASARRAIALLRGDRPWDRVVGWGTIPRGHGDHTTYPSEAGWSQSLIDVDAAMAADPADFGLDAWVDVRDSSPQFDHDGSSAAAFSAYQATWNEAPPSGLWVDLGWCHPKDGTFSPPTGKRAIAATIGAALLTA